MKKMMLTWLTVASLLMGCSGSETSVKGTYRNPVIYADVPDMSVTRAGEYYYMISTTMHLMPGGPVMRSKDLVNWETVSYVFDKLTDNSKYDLIGELFMDADNGHLPYVIIMGNSMYCSRQTMYPIGRIYSRRKIRQGSGSYYQEHNIFMMPLCFLMMTAEYMYSMEPVS